MADEWDNLIPDARAMLTRNGSFDDELRDTSSQRLESSKMSKPRNTKYSPVSSEQGLLSEEQDDFDVTEYVMEYTDIFEASTQQKLDFIDIQEGDAISEASDNEIVAHSNEQNAYERKETPDIDSEDSEDPSRLPPIDTGVDTYGVDVDIVLNNGIVDETEGYDDDLEMAEGNNDKSLAEGHEALSNNIETNLDLVVKIGENGRRDIENEQVDAQNADQENKSGKENEVLDEEKEEFQVEDKKESDYNKTEILGDNDDSDDHTEVDKLLTDKVEKKAEAKKTKSKMISSGTQAYEIEPLLNTSQSPSPEPQESSSQQHRRQFTPREYPGKAVKSIAIGTDDDYPSNNPPAERHFLASPVENQRQQRGKGSVEKTVSRRNIENGKRISTPPLTRYHHREDGDPLVSNSSRSSKTSTPTSTHTAKSTSAHRRQNGSYPSPASQPQRSSKHPRGDRGSQSSDAMFFKSRLPQTSKRHPKRHVWLVRDSEIHRLIAEKATLLRRYKEEGITGRVKSKRGSGFPNYSEVDVLGLPSVGFSGRTKDDSNRTSLPYGKHPSSRLSQGGYRGKSSSEDEDERTNRLGTKGGKSGTFAVGLAARREQAASKQHERGDEEDGCELCAAEAKEKEKHEKKLKELEAAAKAGPHHPRNLMLGIVYSAEFLGSTNLMSPAAPNKAVRLQQAQEAIGRIKVPEGEEQPSSDVDLFISTERIKIVSSESKQPLTDHHLKTISFIADIGNIIVVMARLSSETETETKTWSGKMPDFSPQKQQTEEKTTKVICHVLETPEAQTVAKTVGQAFSIAYHEFLKVNRLNLSEIEDMEYNGILEQQKILGEELSLLADESKSKEVVIHKKYGESLQLMIVESGWGSMIPTVVIAHMDNKGPAAKSGQLNVGNQILAVNGQSLVGLPLLECQNIIRALKYDERVAVKVVSCPPTVEISINRPDTKYQLGFSVQNGMICSLMRGGIAERGGVRVGHKIIEMNGESVVAASHHHIVDILQTTIGELRMKTMPITLYKLLVGLEVPQYI